MNRIEENIKLLSIFYYVLAGVIALFASIPIIHIVLGIIFLVMPEKMCEGDCTEEPNQIIGWVLIGIGSFVMLIGWTFAILAAIAGRFLSRRVHHKFCIAIAAASCLFMPLGTILGVFSLIVLTKKEAEALFAK